MNRNADLPVAFLDWRWCWTPNWLMVHLEKLPELRSATFRKTSVDFVPPSAGATDSTHHRPWTIKKKLHDFSLSSLQSPVSHTRLSDPFQLVCPD